MDISKLDPEQLRALEWLVKNICGFGNGLGVVLDVAAVKAALVALIEAAE